MVVVVGEVDCEGRVECEENLGGGRRQRQSRSAGAEDMGPALSREITQSLVYTKIMLPYMLRRLHLPPLPANL